MSPFADRDLQQRREPKCLNEMTLPRFGCLWLFPKGKRRDLRPGRSTGCSAAESRPCPEPTCTRISVRRMPEHRILIIKKLCMEAKIDQLDVVGRRRVVDAPTILVSQVSTIVFCVQF